MNGVSVHPSFDYVEPNNDIAMLTLSSPIDLTKPCARPLCFDPKFQLTPGQLCKTAGWDLDFGVSTPYILKSATVAIYLGTDCNSYAPSTVHLTSPTKQICTLKPEDGIDICIVGGGGPLFCQHDETKQWSLVGVMAYSHTCLETRMANVFTNSLVYASWIEHEMQRDL
uniref:Peptidase S1 domain-containing protein n=1 Tax=Biomphalaria glabrata TaxID=6526 RepID=A0A2C9KMY1_BIOGL